MVSINAAEAHDVIEQPVVMRAGQADMIELSSAELETPTDRRRGAKAGFAKHLFAGIDLNGLLDTNIDYVFEGDR